MSDVHRIAHGSIVELRLDNPGKLNAFDAGMLEALERHCAAIERDDAVRAVILTAEPAKAFCAGADIAAWGAMVPAHFARHWVREGHRVFDRLARLSRPTIAAVGAHAFGGGLELIAACDMRVLASKTTLALPEGKVGIVPGWSGTQRLVRLIGEPTVKEMALFGRRIGADRAVVLGFAAEIVDDPNARALEIANELDGMSPRAGEIAKHMIHAGAGEDGAALIETLGSGLAGTTADCNEGIAAFSEKRPPQFTGDAR